MAVVRFDKPEAGFGGEVKIPPSKSAAHRMILCAALARGTSRIENVDLSVDIRATIEAVETLGVRTVYDAETKSLTVDGPGSFAREAEINCQESGSTLRFLIPILSALGVSSTLTGGGLLPQRPIGIYRELLPEHGVEVRTDGGLPLHLEGQLRAGRFSLPGNVSSQFITGLLFALPLLQGTSEIVLTTPLESKGYVDLTLAALRRFGISIQETKAGWSVEGKQTYQACDTAVEGDWSQAAFFLAMAAASESASPVRISGLERDSKQGDRACVDLFRQFGLSVEWERDKLVAVKQAAYAAEKDIVIDASQIPDLVPALAVCAGLHRGKTTICHAERLRIKESDRIQSMTDAVCAIGGQAIDTDDGMEITGVGCFRGGKAEGKNDHRVVMALAAAGLNSETPVLVTDAYSIKKSYPSFYEDYHHLGGNAYVIDVG